MINPSSPSILELDFNAQFQRAWDVVDKTQRSIFITGKAGTGKSTFLRFLRDTLKKKIVVLAPTGVAAVNVRGQTIHSFFGFKPDITPDSVAQIRLSRDKQTILKKLDAIVIDEISMVRADLLDCVDQMLRLYAGPENKPFGGVQMVFIGDLFQLPPVVRPTEKVIFETFYNGPYFFNSKVFKDFEMDLVEFETPYRQKQEKFLNILNAIRTNVATSDHLRELNTRYQADFKIPDGKLVISLTTTNALADKINADRLRLITENLHTFEAELSGTFDERSSPACRQLLIKKGAQVMMLNNDQSRRWMNGTLGTVIEIDEPLKGESSVRVELVDGERVDVLRYSWDVTRFFFNDNTQSLDSEVVGSFRQFPLKLAWAVTIHKSQGQTFENLVIDLGGGSFSSGQTYVALSRATTLEGIVLRRPINARDILLDSRVSEFLSQWHYKNARRLCPEEQQKEILQDAIARQQRIEILYLKRRGELNRRVILPRELRQMDEQGQSFWGVEAYCEQRKSDWIFRLPWIVEMKEMT